MKMNTKEVKLNYRPPSKWPSQTINCTDYTVANGVVTIMWDKGELVIPLDQILFMEIGEVPIQSAGFHGELE